MINLLTIPYMAWLSRMSGGAWPKLPLGLDQWLYALPYLLLLLPLSLPMAILGYLGAVMGKRLGHGRGISLLDPMKPGTKPEKLEFLIQWLESKLPVYWYKVLILAVVGFASVLIPAALLWQHPLGALAILASGAIGKPLAYMIGWKLLPQYNRNLPKDLNEATEIAELLAGAFCGLGIYLAL